MARVTAPSLIVFPEARAAATAASKRFKGGIFLLAIESGLPVVPVTVVGSRDVMPKGRLMVCPATVRVDRARPDSDHASSTRDDARALASACSAIIARDARVSAWAEAAMR